MQSPTLPQIFDLAVHHHKSGNFIEAERLYKHVLLMQPNHAGALHFFGLLAHQLGHEDIAADCIRRSMTIDPNDVMAYSSLAQVLHTQGRTEEALRILEEGAQRFPSSAEAQGNLGVMYAHQKQFELAISAFQKALQLKPGFADGHNNLGVAYASRGRLTEAAAAYRQAITLRPNFAEAYNNLGNAFQELGRLQNAIDAFKSAIALRSDYAEAHYNLANALRAQGTLDEAIAEYHRACYFQPNYFEAWNNLGSTLRDQADCESAFAAYERAIQIAPANANIRSNLMYTFLFSVDLDERIIEEAEKKWNEIFSLPGKQAPMATPFNPDPARRIRIGYVSPNFSCHVIGRNLLPLFSNHNRTQFEVFCYSDGRKSDRITDIFRKLTDQWQDTAALTDADLSECIRRDGIDILVDLSQHTAENRLSVFSQAPAPVQLSFAGYPAATGVDAIRYRVSDRWMEKGGIAAPEGILVKTGKRETLCLIDTFWCYDPCGVETQPGETPAAHSEMITFGCLNHFSKVNEHLLGVWARILKDVNHGRFLILSYGGSHVQRTLEFFAQKGIDPQRVKFVTPRPRKDYLELYHRVDIVLDTFPYNGHTTSLDALWMGVPVVSLCGERPVSRAGLSQLSNLGLPELVAFTEDQYVDIATKLANDIPRLQELRATLREGMEKSVLMDGPHFARQIEACYRSMWRQWCESQKT